MEHKPKEIVLSQAEYEALKHLAAQHALLMESLQKSEQARKQAEAKAKVLSKENVNLQRALEEERAKLVKLIKRYVLKPSERYKAQPVEPEKVEAAVETLINTPQTPPVETQKKADKEKQSAQKKRNHPGRRPLPKHLPRIPVIVPPDEDISGCEIIGEEISEELDYMPGYFYVRQFIRYKYARPDDQGVIIAPMPVRVIEKGIPGPWLIAHILVSKYLDHLPLYRQLAIFRRAGIDINEVTFNGWVRQAITQLFALHTIIKNHLMAGDYLMADETTIRVMDPDKKGTTHLGYYWVYMNPLRRSAVFIYEQGRGGEYVRDHLKTYRGHLQTDAYAAYTSLGKSHAGIIMLGCWAHVRRKFFDALEVEKEQSEWFLRQIQHLYAIERYARIMQFSAAERLQLRSHATPVLEEIKAKLLELAPSLPPKNLLAVAIRYALNQWEELLVYTTDGKLEIDNNLVENSIRPIALGRKNYLFAGDHDAAQRGAVIYTIIASCKANDINPTEYLADVLDRVVTRKLSNLDDLLPWNWKPLEKIIKQGQT